MEKQPNWETNPDNKYERELTFDEQVELATVLSKAVGRRSTFIKGQGGFDGLDKARQQHMDGVEEVYSNMEEAISKARQELDAKIPDKEKFVNELRKTGEDRLADVIDTEFGA